MTDHNLDDLIIDNIEPKNRKTKSFLTIIALFIVVLIIGIILTRTILKTPESEKRILNNDPIDYLAPELKLQETPKPEKPVKELKVEDIIEKQPKQDPVPPPTPVVIEKEKVIEKPKVNNDLKAIESDSDEIPEPIVPDTVKTQEKPQNPLVLKSVIQEPEMPKPVENKPTPQPTPVTKQKIVKTPVPIISEPVAKKPVTKKTQTATQQYYVQVGSFSKEPSSRFISVIKKNGFKYHLTKPNSKGTKKLHIGPYKTKAEVNTALKQVKDRINKSAFVVKK